MDPSMRLEEFWNIYMRKEEVALKGSPGGYIFSCLYQEGEKLF